MPSVEALAMLKADAFFDPVTYRFEMRTPFGLVAQELTVDIKILINDSTYYGAIGQHLWSASIATAISSSVSLDMVWYVRWLASPLALPSVPQFAMRGRQSGARSGRSSCALVMMHTGHSDDYAARRITLPATPAVWQADGMLTDRGWDSLMAWAQGLSMGLAADTMGGDLQHLVAYPRIVEPSIDNLNGVGFRRVTHLKVLQYTDKAPDFDGGLWP